MMENKNKQWGTKRGTKINDGEWWEWKKRGDSKKKQMVWSGSEKE
jgi:hypothetical protein